MENEYREDGEEDEQEEVVYAPATNNFVIEDETEQDMYDFTPFRERAAVRQRVLDFTEM